jgi:hypothetical protein
MRNEDFRRASCRRENGECRGRREGLLQAQLPGFGRKGRIGSRLSATLGISAVGKFRGDPQEAQIPTGIRQEWAPALDPPRLRMYPCQENPPTLQRLQEPFAKFPTCEHMLRFQRARAENSSL